MRVFPFLLRYGSMLLVAWAIMLAVGIVHAEWIPALPPIGFALTVMLVAVAFAVRWAVATCFALAAYVDKVADR